MESPKSQSILDNDRSFVIVPYSETHFYYGRLVTCLKKVYDYEQVDLVDRVITQVETAASWYDNLYYLRLLDRSKVESVREKYEDSVPALQRMFRVSVDSGFLEQSFVKEIKEYNVEGKIKEMCESLNIPYDEESVDAIRTTAIGIIRRLIIDGKNVDEYRRLLLWLSFLSQKSQMVVQPKTKLDQYNWRGDADNGYTGTISASGFNYVNDLLVTSTIKIHAPKNKNIIGKPIPFDPEEFLENIAPLIEQIFVSSPRKILLTIGKLNQRKLKDVEARSVHQKVIGPFIFSGNAKRHTFPHYFEVHNVASPEELRQKSPHDFCIATLAQEVVDHPNYYFLVSSTTRCDSLDKEEMTGNFYLSPEMKLPKAEEVSTEHIQYLQSLWHAVKK